MASKWFEDKSIAIVGNASFIFERDYGKKIDSFDVVVRINKGYLDLNNKHQGTKTDVLAYNNYSMIDNIFFYPLKCLEELKKKINFDRPSTGLMIIDYVLSCNPKSINLYGFDFKKTPTYYEKDRKIEPHNFDLEKKYIEKLKLKINN